MVKIVLAAVLALGSCPALAEEQSPAVINLICAGSSLKDETVGSALDLLAGNGRTERIESEDSISFTINPDNTGSARLPRRMASSYREPNKDGSFTIVKVLRSDTDITGLVRIHAGNKLAFRLDRLTGLATLTGPLASFSGHCEAYDPATVVKKF